MPGPGADSRTDQQLISAANAGDVRAFEALYERYRDWVVHLAMRFTHDHALAMDVMQDTFMYLLRKFPGFELTAQFKTFLYPVVRHNALAAQRSKKRSDTVGSIDAAITTPHDLDERTRALAKAVDALDAGHREVVFLRFVDGLSLQEISLAMEIPLGTVKSRLHHALGRLRADPALQDFFEQP